MKRLFLSILLIVCPACLSMLFASEEYKEDMDSLLHRVLGHRQGIILQDEEGVKLKIHTSCYFKAPNDVYYYRWWSDEQLFGWGGGSIYTPVCEERFCDPLDFGYRFDDEKMYVYNFKTEKESVACDFTLQPGEQFTTPDGVCWKVVSRRKVAFESSFDYHTDYKNEHVVLSVQSLDGTMSDEWVQYIGSLHYPMQYWGRTDIKRIHTAFFNFSSESEKLVYFNFSEDPIYGQYVEVDPGPNANTELTRDYVITAGCDSLNIAINYYTFFTRHYCYTYRNGNTFDIHSWELGPLRDGDNPGVPSFGLTFPGAPLNDNYTIVYNGETLSTSVNALRESSITSLEYDLSGRRLTTPPTRRGIYVNGGRKVFIK